MEKLRCDIFVYALLNTIFAFLFARRIFSVRFLSRIYLFCSFSFSLIPLAESNKKAAHILLRSFICWLCLGFSDDFQFTIFSFSRFDAIQFAFPVFERVLHSREKRFEPFGRLCVFLAFGLFRMVLLRPKW